jgi:hypothetical protein
VSVSGDKGIVTAILRARGIEDDRHVNYRE